MKLKEYIKQFHKSVEEFSVRCDISSALLWHYMGGRRHPSQKSAERIEKESGGRVTVMELRGQDKRIKDGIPKPE